MSRHPGLASRACFRQKLLQRGLDFETSIASFGNSVCLLSALSHRGTRSRAWPTSPNRDQGRANGSPRDRETLGPAGEESQG